MASTTTLTVKLINPPAPGKSRGSIVGMDGQRIGAFGEKIGLFEVGKTYEVEYVESEYNGSMLKNVRSAKEIASAPAAQGTAHIPAAAPFRTPEQMSVTEIICAYIASGRCEPDKLKEIIGYVRRAWNSHYGDDIREAAE